MPFVHEPHDSEDLVIERQQPAEQSVERAVYQAQPPQPEWGLIVASARMYLLNAWWYSAFPGLTILVTVLSFNLVGDGLREVLDPRTKVR